MANSLKKHNSKNDISSLSETVDKLQRAAVGSSKDIEQMTSAELDQYVRQMLLKEASERKTKYEHIGVDAYVEPLRRVERRGRADSGFLKNVIKHNAAHNRVIEKSTERLKQEKHADDVPVKQTTKRRRPDNNFLSNLLQQTKTNNDGLRPAKTTKSTPRGD
jgi:hypothetical protein